MKRYLRRTELQQNDEGDWYVELEEGESVLAIDYESASIKPQNFGGGGGGGGYYPRRPVVWIDTHQELT